MSRHTLISSEGFGPLFPREMTSPLVPDCPAGMSLELPTNQVMTAEQWRTQYTGAGRVPFSDLNVPGRGVVGEGYRFSENPEVLKDILKIEIGSKTATERQAMVEDFVQNIVGLCRLRPKNIVFAAAMPLRPRARGSALLKRFDLVNSILPDKPVRSLGPNAPPVNLGGGLFGPMVLTYPGQFKKKPETFRAEVRTERKDNGKVVETTYGEWLFPADPEKDREATARGVVEAMEHYHNTELNMAGTLVFFFGIISSYKNNFYSDEYIHTVAPDELGVVRGVVCSSTMEHSCIINPPIRELFEKAARQMARFKASWN